MRSAHRIKAGLVFAIAGAGIGCSATPTQQARSHAELSREAMLARDEALFAVGDDLGARMVRTAEAAQDESPVFVRQTEIGFQAADALGAVGMSSRPTLATVLDDE